MIYPFLSSDFESNCFLVVGKKVALVDAGNPAPVLWKIGELGIGIDYLISTHLHYDHVLGLEVLHERTHGMVLMHEADASALENGDSSTILSGLFSSRCPKLHVDWKLKDGDIIDLGDIYLEVIHTPGHTGGCICLYEQESKSLFSGDTVFADGVGRTDFPGGSSSDLKKSVEKLLKLHRDRGVGVIYPGHGPLAKGKVLEEIYKEYFGII